MCGLGRHILHLINICVTCFRKCNCGVKPIPKPTKSTPKPPTPNTVPTSIFESCEERKYCISDWHCPGGFCAMDEKKRFKSGYSIRANPINLYFLIIALKLYF